jgi:predicted amidohydrolase YtcJ
MVVTTGGFKADSVIVNGNILTVDRRRPRVEAVAIRGGRFVAVGSTEEIQGLIGPGTGVLDATGKTVLPGFIGAHVHVVLRHLVAYPYKARTRGFPSMAFVVHGRN